MKGNNNNAKIRYFIHLFDLMNKREVFSILENHH